MLARFDPAERLLPVAFVLAAIVVGVLAGIDPKFAVAGSLGIAFLLLGLADLSAGLVAFTLILFLEVAPAIGGPALSFTKLAGGVLALSWLATLAERRASDEMFWVRYPGLSWVLAGFMAWITASFFWAENPAQSLLSTSKVALDILLFLITLTAVKSERTVRGVLTAFVGGATLAAAYGIITQPDQSSAAYSPTAATTLDRLSGTIGDPNVLASLLVVGLILALALAATERDSPLKRGLLIIAVALCATGVFLTGSRGGLVSLGAGMLAAVLLTPRHRLVTALAALAVALSGLTYYAVLAPDAAVQRITTADGGAGRTDIWKIGWRMFEDKPLHGVGAANFPVSSIHYLLIKPGAFENDEFVVDEPAVAHNSFLEVAAELGVPGIVLFLAILAGSIGCMAKAARVFSGIGNGSMEILATSVAVALCALLAADFFISQEYSKQLWLLLALGPAMLTMARCQAHEIAASRNETRT